MSKAHNAELQARVQQYMREHGMSQARLAQVSGINKAIISQWLRGQYNGDIAATEQAIEEYLRTAMEHEHGRRIRRSPTAPRRTTSQRRSQRTSTT